MLMERYTTDTPEARRLAGQIKMDKYYDAKAKRLKVAAEAALAEEKSKKGNKASKEKVVPAQGESKEPDTLDADTSKS